MDTLRKVLRRYEPGTKIKVGTADGSLWFYFGTNDDLESHIIDYSEKVEKMWRKKLSNAKQGLKALLTSATLEGYINSQMRRMGEPDFTLKGYMDHIEQCMRRIGYYASAIERSRTMTENPMPLSSRGVKSCYVAHNFADLGYVCITVEGCETGAFWSSDEADKVPVMMFDTSVDAEKAEGDTSGKEV